MSWKRILLGVLVLGVGVVSADSIDINVNDDAVRGAFISELEKRNLEIDYSFLHGENDTDLAAIGLQLVDFVGGGSRVSVGLGGRTAFFESDVNDGSALGLGGHVTFEWPGVRGLEVHAFAFYAPDAITFGDAEEYLDTGLRVGYRMLDKATVYLGVRSVRTDFEFGPSVTLDSGVHGGFRISF